MTDYSSHNDADLMALLVEDSAAFTEFYDRYWSILYRAAYNVLRDKQASLDVVQEVFIWFWENSLQINVVSVKAYLLVAVKYKVANSIRNGKVRDSFYERLSNTRLKEYYVDEELEVKELQLMIANSVSQLPEKCKVVFNLSRHEHLSHKEISIKLGISEKTVKNQINKALKRLKIDLGRLSIFLSLF